jgi:hypothetical protein
MNNFLRQFGTFKKNVNGLNEYVDYLGTHYTQDPNTGMWKNNGRSLNEQMFAQEAMNTFGGYGEEGSGDKYKKKLYYDLGFAATQNQLVGMADPFEDLIEIVNGTVTPSEIRYFTVAHNTPVRIKLKLIEKTMDFTPQSATLVFNALPTTTTRITFNLLSSSVNDESSTFTVPFPLPTSVSPTAQFIYEANHFGGAANGDILEFGISIINAETNQTIDTFLITDTADVG